MMRSPRENGLPCVVFQATTQTTGRIRKVGSCTVSLDCRSRFGNHQPLGYCPHTVTVYNRATIMGLVYPYYEYCSTVTEWGQCPASTLKGPKF